MADDRMNTVVEFTILIPALDIKMTSGLSKEDAIRILKKVMIAISLAKNECDYDNFYMETDESKAEQS